MTDFASLLQPDRGQSARTITLLTPETFDAWLNRQSAATRALASAQRFTAKPGTHVLIPDGDGIAVVAGVADASSPWALAKLAEALPEGSYRLDGVEVGANALGWLLGQYRFTRYRKAEDAAPRVLLTRDVAHRDEIIRIAAATAQVRDLVNSGAGDLGPAELEAEAQTLARAHHADVTVTSGEALARDYPMIHAVGQAATRERAPRLIELHWGDPSHPRIAIVGKGVCFDTGGLDIKPSAGMRLMKKDMGGAAHALALAGLDGGQAAGAAPPADPGGRECGVGGVLPPRRRAADAQGPDGREHQYRRRGPVDPGRRADPRGEEAPELILDFATLTGAARVALGPDLPPLFTDDEALAADLLTAGVAEDDPVWRMPLWDGYDDMLKSDIADMVNAPDGGFAGAITAALFLRRFVPKDTAWAHLDVFRLAALGQARAAQGRRCLCAASRLCDVEEALSGA